MRTGYDCSTKIILSGKVSAVGDPDEEPWRSECRDRRNGFWAGYGFQLKEPTEFHTSMKAKLSDLSLRIGVTANGIPKNLALEKFWEKGKTPKFFKSDLQALMSTNLERFNFNTCPTKAEIDKAWNKAMSEAKVIRYFFWTLLSGVLIYFSLSLLSPLEALSFSLPGAFGSLLLLTTLEYRALPYFPSYQRYLRIQGTRTNTLVGIKEDIQAIERSHNGLIWRLHQGLKEFDSSLADETFSTMANVSKKQSFYELSDRYEDYQRFIESAKTVITNHNLLERVPVVV